MSAERFAGRIYSVAPSEILIQDSKCFKRFCAEAISQPFILPLLNATCPSNDCTFHERKGTFVLTFNAPSNTIPHDYAQSFLTKSSTILNFLPALSENSL